MPRRNRDYAAEYAHRKREAQRGGFSGVRAQRNFNRDFDRYQRARNPSYESRGPTVRRPRRVGAPAPRPADPRVPSYNPDRYNKSWVMANWDLYGFFDNWREAADWYDAQP